MLGADQLMVTDFPVLATACTLVGAPGTVAGVAAADSSEAAPLPLALAAVTLKV